MLRNYMPNKDMQTTRHTHIILWLNLTKAVFTQRSLSDLTLDQSKVRSDKVCVNTLNRIGTPGR